MSEETGASAPLSSQMQQLALDNRVKPKADIPVLGDDFESWIMDFISTLETLSEDGIHTCMLKNVADLDGLRWARSHKYYIQLSSIWDIGQSIWRHIAKVARGQMSVCRTLWCMTNKSSPWSVICLTWLGCDMPLGTSLDMTYRWTWRWLDRTDHMLMLCTESVLIVNDCEWHDFIIDEDKSVWMHVIRE